MPLTVVHTCRGPVLALHFRYTEWQSNEAFTIRVPLARISLGSRSAAQCVTRVAVSARDLAGLTARKQSG